MVVVVFMMVVVYLVVVDGNLGWYVDCFFQYFFEDYECFVEYGLWDCQWEQEVYDV